jgi:hypothetical protein
MDSKKTDKIHGVLTIPPVSKFNELLEVRGKYFPPEERWIYRGEDSEEFELKSTFERAMNDKDLKKRGRAPWEYEAAITREFRRRAHHFISDVPSPDNVLEWFALMRHFGAPCRLLDFTYSIYVAAYFSLRKPRDVNGFPRAAVWAINTDWIYDCLRRSFNLKEGKFTFKDPKMFYRFFLNHKKPKPFVSVVNPFRMNQRLTAQQGLFLCPGDISKKFMDNLVKPGTKENPKQIIKIPIELSGKTDFIQELRRMNITSATLFPDLSGFAESLNDWFHLKIKLYRKELEDILRGKIM